MSGSLLPSSQILSPSQPPGNNTVKGPGKTHRNARITELLRALPRADKIKRNDLINSRNLQREIARAYSEANNTQEAISSNESLITVPDEETATASLERSPGSQAKAFISSLSPNSAKSWMKSIFRKRRRETSDDDSDSSDEESVVQKSRKYLEALRNEEVAPGIALPPKFNRHHHIHLINNIYMPLTLFTNRNLQHISRDGPVLATTEISVCDGDRIKSVNILDIVKFEALYGAEEDLSSIQWIEAARNYVQFFKSLETECQQRSSRWDAHFNFFKVREDFFKNFKTILLLDIRMRKDYISQPFTFSAEYYAFELLQMIWDQRDAEIRSMKEETMQSLVDRQGSIARPTGTRRRRRRRKANIVSSRFE